MKIRISFAILLTIMLHVSTECNAQSDHKYLFTGMNYSFHGSGDLNGVLINFDLEKKSSKHFYVDYNLGFSFHTGLAFPGFITNAPSTPPDLRTDVPRWVTAGIQLSSFFTYRFSSKKQSGLKLGVAPVFRFQLNSSPNGYQYYGSQNAWFRQPFYVFKETDNNHFNIGYCFRIIHDWKLKEGRLLGFNCSFQNDSNGDAISSIGIRYGFRFKTKGI